MSNANKPLEYAGLWEVSVIVTEKKGKPAVELRSLTTDLDLIKILIGAAYHSKPVIIMPKFTNVMQSLNSCIEKGILFREDDKYFFTI